ncbi:MAG: ABC transporter substrate-binding protein [Gammaproteobacteria bacterium]|nr:ABC transporter substrate-binding protein [Gammaproteobacteria bacterium]
MTADRIVTLLPSATEIVCALGLGSRLVGVTHECDWPAGVESLPHLTRSAIPSGLSSGEIDAIVRDQLGRSDALYHIDAELLASLEPDLVVTQALCDVCAVTESEVQAAVARLPRPPRVINLEPMSLEEVLETIGQVGHTAGCEHEATRVVGELRARIGAVVHRKQPGSAPRLGFLEWIDPPFNGGH